MTIVLSSIMYLFLVFFLDNESYFHSETESEVSKTDIYIEATRLKTLNQIENKIRKLKEDLIKEKINQLSEINKKPYFSELLFLEESLVRGYLIGDLSTKETLHVKLAIDSAINRLSSKVSLSELLLIKNDNVARSIFKEAVIHYFLSRNNNKLFNDTKTIFNSVMGRAILLAAIAERETGYFDYNLTIFSPTQAFGRFQINGNTLGFNFLKTLDILKLKLSDFNNREYVPSPELYKNLYSDIYMKNVNKYYKVKEKNRIRIKLLKAESKFLNDISYKLFSKMNIKNLYNKELKKNIDKLYFYQLKRNNGDRSSKNNRLIIKYEKKISKISSLQLKNIKVLLKRTIYGVEKYASKNIIKSNNAFKRRLKIIEISASLIESSIFNQGVYSLIVAESKFKYAYSKNHRLRSLDITRSKKSFRETVRVVSMHYNGGELKKNYGRRASNHAMKSLDKINAKCKISIEGKLI